MRKLFLAISEGKTLAHFSEEFARIKPHINTVWVDDESKSVTQKTLLIQAILYDRADIVHFLLTKKAKHSFALHLALSHKKFKAFNALVQASPEKFLTEECNKLSPVLPRKTVLQLAAEGCTPEFFARILDLLPPIAIQTGIVQSYAPLVTTDFTGISSGLGHIARYQSFENIQRVIALCKPQTIYKAMSLKKQMLSLSECLARNATLTPDQRKSISTHCEDKCSQHLNPTHLCEDLLKAENAERKKTNQTPLQECSFFELIDFKKCPPNHAFSKSVNIQHVNGNSAGFKK